MRLNSFPSMRMQRSTSTLLSCPWGWHNSNTRLKRVCRSTGKNTTYLASRIVRLIVTWRWRPRSCLEEVLPRGGLASRRSCLEEVLPRGGLASRRSCLEEVLPRGGLASRRSCLEEVLPRGGLASRRSCLEEVLPRGGLALILNSGQYISINVSS